MALPISIPVENMSHLTSSFMMRGDASVEKYIDRDFEGIHPSQMSKRRIKLILIFMIPGEEQEHQNEEEQQSHDLPRFASVRVPKGVSVARVRSLIQHIESQLQDIYGRTKRANFVMIANDESDNWRFEFDLPTAGVVYV